MDKSLQILLELNLRMSGKFELQQLLREITATIRDFMNSEGCSIVLADETNDDLYFYVSADKASDLQGFRLKRGQGIVGKVVESGTPVIVNNVAEDDSFFDGIDKMSGLSTRSIICVPMTIANRVIGALEAVNKTNGEDFCEEEITLLEIVGTQAALALEYSRFYEKQIMDERLSMVGRMSAQIVHDLKNSMNVISGLAQVMLIDHPEFGDFGELINHEIDRVRSMSIDVLDYTRGDTSRCNPSPVNIDEFLENIFLQNNTCMKMSDIDFKLEINYACTVMLDPHRFERALVNLLSNARDALENGKREIILGSRHENGYPVIFVKDTGTGMDEETIRKLYTPFFTYGKKDGTGLGMSIVSSIMKAHKAKIDVHSIPGEGTEFKIILNPF